MAILAALYGLVVYVFFLATFVYAIGFVGNLPLLPKTHRQRRRRAAGRSADRQPRCCSALFAVQHSVMARRGFKRWWTRIDPRSGGAQHLRARGHRCARAAAVAVAADRRAGAVVGRATRSRASRCRRVFWLGWARAADQHVPDQPLRAVRAAPGVGEPARPARSRRRSSSTPLFYRHVRHPIYLGFVLAFWATPQMTPATCCSRRPPPATS